MWWNFAARGADLARATRVCSTHLELQNSAMSATRRECTTHILMVLILYVKYYFGLVDVSCQIKYVCVMSCLRVVYPRILRAWRADLLIFAARISKRRPARAGTS